MKTAMITKQAVVLIVVLGLCGYAFEAQILYAEDSNDTYIVVDDMEDYNDRDEIREVWKDGYTPWLPPWPYPGSSGSNLNVSTAVGSPFNGATGPVINDQAMVLRYDNDGFTYSGLPGEEEPLYPAPYYSEIQAYTVGDNSLNVGQDWAATGCTQLSLWFQGHPVSDGDFDSSLWPVYTLSGRGRDIGGRHDEFYFVSQYPFVGDGGIQVHVLGMDNTDPWAKAGVMIREKWTPYSRFAAVFMTPGNGVTFHYRDIEDGPVTSITKPGVTTPQYLKLERTDSDYFIAKHSDTGYLWQDVNAPGQAPVFPTIDMGTVEDPDLYIGTAVTSHNADEICSAEFDALFIQPAPPPNWDFGNIGTNDPEQLYVALEDTGGNVGVVEHENVNSATMVTWQEWKIPLTAFSGVDFSSIKKVYIGLGDRDNPVVGGSGTVYIDEIYLSGIPVGETYHVDGVNGDNTNDGLTPETALATIQRGINVAEDFDTVLVWPGVYKEEVGFWGDAITVKSAADAAVVETDYGYAFSFFSAERPDTVLSNFIIRDSQYGIYLINGASPTLTNLTIVNNDFGISAFNGADPDISNCILWGNNYGDLFREPVSLQARYSCIEEGGEGEGNISVEPGFVDANSGDYHLLSERGRYWPTHDVWVLDEVTSPCVDGGDPAVDPANERMPNGSRINMGAYGNTAYASMSECWSKADFNCDGVVDFKDFAIMAESWLDKAAWIE
jgi:parallel beta-helix repeat protein